MFSVYSSTFRNVTALAKYTTNLSLDATGLAVLRNESLSTSLDGEISILCQPLLGFQADFVLRKMHFCILKNPLLLSYFLD